MNSDYVNNVTFERPPREGDRALLFPENKTLVEALVYLDDLAQDKDEAFYEEFLRDGERRVEEEVVSHAKFLLPIEVWEEDLTRGDGGAQALKDGAKFTPCTIGRTGDFANDAEYLPLFTDWNALYKQPYPGHVRAMVVTFADCLRLIEKGEGEKGLAINPGETPRLFYDSASLRRLAALRESLVEAGRIDGDWTFGPREHRGPSAVLRGPQDRVRVYLPASLGMSDRGTDDPIDGVLLSTKAACAGTVRLAPGVRELLWGVLSTLCQCRLGSNQMSRAGIFEVYAKTVGNCDTLHRIGRIHWDHTDGGECKIQWASDDYPAIDLIYCDFLSEGAERLVLEPISDDKIASGYKRHLEQMLQYCALYNTYLMGCSYTYSGEEAAREYAAKRAEGDTQNMATSLVVTIPMMLLGALLMYVTRAALWPGLLAVVGCLFFLLVLPVAAGTGVLHLICRSKVMRVVREEMGDGRLPAAGQHHARFSMRPGGVLYRDEGGELRDEGFLDVSDSKRYLFVSLQNGIKIPVPKSAL